MPAGHDISFARFPPVTYTDENSVVMEDTALFTQFFRLTLTGGTRGTFSGSARITVTDSPNDPSTLRFRSPTSATVNPDEYVIRHNRVIFNGNVRETISGTGRSIMIDDLAPRPGRLILSGAGGGN